MRKFYGLAWFLLMGSALVSIYTGSLNEVGMVAFSLIGLALVYALAMWAVFSDPGSVHGE